ncbi:endonuclease/exonuclease/phosphatase family protein [Solicola gregarius]|uniref:Endonuclease/exonuclease/phosphatase family protein n=1 Tax=Solicola gregarius TaxID=2908642 RepID=A0AA46TGD2_9ACTN|nr:endonuclease/exonuclease/phosphatase family protein [Solicola gregarius]UYM04698.1 endonuclease/exonuclease/phosphatase family protein [Solicola gregarius]
MVLLGKPFAAAAAAATALTLLAAPGAAQADGGARAADRVSVLTYNTCMNDACRKAYRLGASGKRLAKIWKHAVNRDGGKKRADVVVLQETDWRVVGVDGDKLTKAFPGYRIASKRDGRWILYNTAALTRINDGYVNVAGAADEEKAFPWAQFASKAHPRNKVTVVDVHFASRSDKPEQAKEIRRLKRGLGEQLPLGTRTVFAGDFNILPGEPNARLFRSTFAKTVGGLTDATPKRKRTNTLKPADVPKIPYRPSAGKPIDHVYVGGGLHVVKGARYRDKGEKRVTSKRAERKRWNRLVPKRRSDHNAVYAVLRW